MTPQHGPLAEDPGDRPDESRIGTSQNRPLADDLDELAALLRAGRTDRFRVRAYERVARLVRRLPVPVAELEDRELHALEGVGATTARMLREHGTSGRIGLLEGLREREPPGVGALLTVPLLGLRDARRLAGEHGVDGIAALARAAADPGGLDALEPRLAARVPEALRRLPARRDDRSPLPAAERDARALADGLADLPAVRRVVVAGAVRRGVELVRDLDLVVVLGDTSQEADAAATDAADADQGGDRLAEALAGCPGVVRVLDIDGDGVRVLTSSGRAARLWCADEATQGAVLLTATGPLSHLHALGVRERPPPAPDEARAYAAMGLPVIPPALRGTGGEVEAARTGALPSPVRHGDLLGDLHVHSDFSGDGQASLEEMVRGAAGRGYAYVALTDHAEGLAINGMTREAVQVRHRTIAEVQRRHPHVRVLAGAELNIDLAGGLDYDPELLLGFDLCVASIHSDMARERAVQTERILAAMASPAVHVIGHPTGRILGQRPGYAIDLAAIAEAAAETGTALEVNGSPARLDLDGAMARAAVRAGALLSLASDAHSLDELGNVAHAVAVARRGWAEVGDVLNTRDLDGLLAFTAAKRKAAGA